MQLILSKKQIEKFIIKNYKMKVLYGNNNKINNNAIFIDNIINTATSSKYAVLYSTIYVR